jgi:putative glutathione S-transferase
VYYGHFKCNVRRITEYPNLWNYLKDLYQVPGVAETCNFTHIKEHYHRSHESINPTRIVPRGPVINFNEPHDRERFAGR